MVAALCAVSASALALDVGQPVAELGLEDLEGRRWTAGALRGRVVLVDFWASWCQPCADEMPLLQRLHDQYGPSGLTVVGVSVDRDISNVRQFVGRHGVTFPIVHDAAQEVVARFGAPRMPTSYLVDRAGVVRYRQDGFHAGEARAIEQRVRELLVERAPR